MERAPITMNPMKTQAARLIDRLFSLRTECSRFGQQEVEDALVALGPAAVPELVQALRPSLQRTVLTFVWGRDPACSAARALGRIGDPRAVGALVWVVRRGPSPIASTAADALGLIGDRRAVPALSKLLLGRHEYPLDMRYYAAARALARLAEAEEVDVLCSALQVMARATADTSHQKLKRATQEELMARLAQIGDPRVIRRLLALRNAKFVTVSALVEFGPGAIPALLEVLASEAGLDANKALLALMGLGGQVLPAHRAHVPGPPVPLTGRCAVALCGLGELAPDLIPPVILAIERSWSRGPALEALTLLAEQFNDLSLRTAIPILRRILRSRWPATSGLTLSDPLFLLCRKALVQIEWQTGALQSLPVIAEAPPPDLDDLPVVSE